MVHYSYKTFLKMDRSLRYAVGTRIWQALASVITLLLILKCTQPSEQGIFYLFTSLANLQIFFELGLSSVILQSTPHYFKSLSWRERGVITGSETNLQPLLTFAQKSMRIYFILACGFIAVMIPLGLMFFSIKHDLNESELRLPWILLVLGTGLNLIYAPLLAVLEGSGKVTEVYNLRIKQLIVANSLAWAVFFMTNALFILVVNAWVTGIITIGWLVKTHPQFVFMVMRSLQSRLSFSWRTEIWPMQWRIATVWMCGYVTNQMMPPLLYYFQGVVISGQMGICLLMANMIAFFSITWVSVRSPMMGSLVASSDRKRLDHVFLVAFWQSILIFILGSVGLLVLGLFMRNHAIMSRFLPLSEMALLLLAYLFAHIITVLSLYLRAHRVELFTRISVVDAGLIAVIAWFGAIHYGSLGVTWSILIVNACYGFPSALWLWVKFKQKWRDNDEQNNDVSKTYDQHSNLEPS